MVEPVDTARHLVQEWEQHLSAERRGAQDEWAVIVLTNDIRDKLILDITVALNEAVRREVSGAGPFQLSRSEPTTVELSPDRE